MGKRTSAKAFKPQQGDSANVKVPVTGPPWRSLAPELWKMFLLALPAKALLTARLSCSKLAAGYCREAVNSSGTQI